MAADLVVLKAKEPSFSQLAYVLDKELAKNGPGNIRIVDSLFTTLQAQVRDFVRHKLAEFPIPEQHEAARLQNLVSEKLRTLKQKAGR